MKTLRAYLAFPWILVLGLLTYMINTLMLPLVFILKGRKIFKNAILELIDITMRLLSYEAVNLNTPPIPKINPNTKTSKTEDGIIYHDKCGLPLDLCVCNDKNTIKSVIPCKCLNCGESYIAVYPPGICIDEYECPQCKVVGMAEILTGEG